MAVATKTLLVVVEVMKKLDVVGHLENAQSPLWIAKAAATKIRVGAVVVTVMVVVDRLWHCDTVLKKQLDVNSLVNRFHRVMRWSQVVFSASGLYPMTQQRMRHLYLYEKV